MSDKMKNTMFTFLICFTLFSLNHEYCTVRGDEGNNGNIKCRYGKYTGVEGKDFLNQEEIDKKSREIETQFYNDFTSSFNSVFDFVNKFTWMDPIHSLSGLNANKVCVCVYSAIFGSQTPLSKSTPRREIAAGQIQINDKPWIQINWPMTCETGGQSFTVARSPKFNFCRGCYDLYIILIRPSNTDNSESNSKALSKSKSTIQFTSTENSKIKSESEVKSEPEVRESAELVGKIEKFYLK